MPLVLKNLDDYHLWPIKHRHWTFDLVEDESHDIWVSTEDLRRFYDRFPSDKALKDIYHRSMLYAKDTKTYYLAERVMRAELRKSKNYSCHTDVLKFLDWYDRNVAQVVAKKRSNTHLDETKVQRTRLAHKISDTRPNRISWKDWGRGQFKVGLDYLLSFWRGELNVFLTVCVGLLIAKFPEVFFRLIASQSLDWASSYKRVMWASALVVPVAGFCAIFFAVSMTRSTRYALKRPLGMLWATTLYVFAIPLAPWIFLSNYDGEMVEYWWASMRGRYEAITVYADPHLGRIVLKGAIRFGSADALQTVLEQNPKFTLVQIESPGGFVIEGMRMARLVEQRKMDTVALEGCASACTFVLAAGVDRYLGPDVRVGFHRSGTRYGPVSLGWTETDHQIANYYRARGVNEVFVQKALAPSIRQVWLAPHADMVAAGYASKRWDERKTGY